MERPINDFDEDIFQFLGGEIAEENNKFEYDINDDIDMLTGQCPLRLYNPLKPILNRLNMKAVNSDDSDYFGETPAFI